MDGPRISSTLLTTHLVSYRQHSKLHEPKIPKALASTIKQSTFDKSRAYGLDKSKLNFVRSFYSLLISLAMIYYNGYKFMWDLSGVAVNYLGQSSEIPQSLVFLFGYALFSTVIKLPFTLYSTFVVEQKHGFNKQTIGLFFSDLFKSFLLGIIIGAPVIAGIIYIIQSTGSNFYFYVWAFMLLFQLLMVSIYPTLIQPLFNKFTPLEDGSLKKSIDALAERIAFPLTKVFVVDGSKRSGHSNAYFFGFFKNKRIVLFDTLLEQNDEQETCAVLAHELGHWKHNHVLQMLIFSNIQSFIMYYLFGFALKSTPLFEAFGFKGAHPVVIGFLLFLHIFTPVDEITSFVFAIVSRAFEYQADAFAKGLGYEKYLKSGLIKLNVENLGNMNPDPWYSAWHHSHPTLVERLAALEKSDKKKK